MRLCLKLTRKHCNAVKFADMEGPKTLLSLTQENSFDRFTSLTALLFHHILEDSNTLSFTMEKVRLHFIMEEYLCSKQSILQIKITLSIQL